MGTYILTNPHTTDEATICTLALYYSHNNLDSGKLKMCAFKLTENVVQALRRAGGCSCACHEGIQGQRRYSSNLSSRWR
jgi:hypothetical protein